MGSQKNLSQNKSQNSLNRSQNLLSEDVEEETVLDRESTTEAMSPSHQNKNKDKDDGLCRTNSGKELKLNHLAGHNLLVSLMKKNVGEVKLTAEQKALHEAFHTLMDELKRRRKARKDTGEKFKRAQSKIKNMLKAKTAWNGTEEGKQFLKTFKANTESDLQLKSRSTFLQKRKAAVKKEVHSVISYSDKDRI